MERHKLATALTEAARAIGAPCTLDETLNAIVGTARQLLGGIDHVGISLGHRNGRIETKVGTGQLVWELDDLQYRLGEGPCVYAIEVEPVVVVQHAAQDRRWPLYIPLAVQLGLRSQLALQLYHHEQTLGGLNLYSITRDTIDAETLDTAKLYAAHAALALGHALEHDGLNIALSSRKVIGQALGILMERYGITEERAWAFLTRASSRSNVKLRDVAAELVAQAGATNRQGLGGPGEATRGLLG
jgi:transcriptional regulator with GAF, ATPase, and Fis domain